MGEAAVPSKTSFCHDDQQVTRYVFFQLFKLVLFCLGQTLRHVGIWLRSDVFTHGQLYVACSRVGNPDGLKFAIMTENKKNKNVANVVFKEILL